MPDPLVSVLIISYNHEKYIRQAIEGCLMQQTSFPYEIIIHDDASTDSSAKIIQEYADKYPELIIPILQKENQYSKGVRIIATLLIPVARGKYIALCEGDDYWTNPQKLERQVDFLEKHSEFSGSAHQSLVLKEKIQKIFKQKVKPNLCLNDLLSGRVFHTASFLFRKKLYEKYPILSKPVLSFDRLLFLMIAAYGPIYFIDDPMCVYRKHDKGMSSVVTYEMLKKDFAIVDYLQQNIYHFPKYRCLSFIHFTCMEYPQETLPIPVILKHYFLSIFYSFSYFPKNIRDVALYTRGFFRVVWRRFKSQTNKNTI